jgi:hypothetical protein
MINYKDFWLSLQLGKWRSESIRRQFQSNVSHFLFYTLLWYVFATFSFWALQSKLTFLAGFDFFTFNSALVGLLLTGGSIAIGFSSYFAQQQAKPEIITYEGLIEYQKTRTLVTFFNKGETIVIRYILVIAFKEQKGFFSKFSTLPRLDIIGYSGIFHGWQILESGKFTGVVESEVKRALIELATPLKTNTNGIQIALMAFDENFTTTKFSDSLSRSIIAGCRLGELSQMSEYINGKTEDLPGLIKGQKMYFSVSSKDLKTAENGQPFQMKMIRETPPNVCDIDYEIWKKLESIESLLKDQGKKANNKK